MQALGSTNVILECVIQDRTRSRPRMAWQLGQTCVVSFNVSKTSGIQVQHQNLSSIN